MGIRHSRMFRSVTNGATPSRLRRAQKTLAVERERLPLFADQVTAEQPAAEHRIAEIDAAQAGHMRSFRGVCARQWRWGRAQLAACDDRNAIVADWNAITGPATSEYFADFVRCAILGHCGRISTNDQR